MSNERQDKNRSDDYLWDGTGTPDPEVERLENLLGGLRYERPMEMVVPRRRRWLAPVLGLAVAAAVLLVVGRRWLASDDGDRISPRVDIYNHNFAGAGARCTPTPGAASWGIIDSTSGARCGGAAVPEKARLPIGAWLETDKSSSAELAVADIGTVSVKPNSRVRLLRTNEKEHRLQLAKGHISAQISAPPRLFFVETPSAVAVDLGCAYDLRVDEQGVGHLHVTLGFVSLERDGREVLVPAGNMCDTRPGVGPGSPYAASSSKELRAALRRVDFEGGSADDVATVIREARSKADTITLWHLMIRSKSDRRDALYDALARMAPPPETVSLEAVKSGDKEALKAWRASMEDHWFHDRKGKVDPDDL
jgi:hypothetical protein